MSDILRNLRAMQGVYEKSPASFPSTARMYKEAADEIERLSNQLGKAHEALRVIRDCFWRDGETYDERIADLKQIARDALSDDLSEGK